MTATPSTSQSVTTLTGASRRWLTSVGTLLLAGPVLFDLGYALHPSLPADAAAAIEQVDPVRHQYVASKLTVAVGSLLLIALVLTLRRRLVPHRGHALATIGATLVAVGMAGNAMSQATHGYLLFWASAPGVEPGAGLAVVEAAQSTDGLVTLPVSFLSVPLFALGMVLFAAALWRAGTVPRWVPIVLILGGFGAGAIGTGPAMLGVLVLDAVAYGTALASASKRAEGGTVGE